MIFWRAVLRKGQHIGKMTFDGLDPGLNLASILRFCVLSLQPHVPHSPAERGGRIRELCAAAAAAIHASDKLRGVQIVSNLLKLPADLACAVL